MLPTLGIIFNMLKVCDACQNEFKPSSKHRNCPSCRYHMADFVLCHVCKARRHSPKYNNCIHCTNLIKPNYGKGRYKKNGYIMVFQKGHPRAQGNGGNYVFEHILVMEKLLGRHLITGENVHHKNGVRDDNSVDNLELWVKPQPSGVRAKDALVWAKQILALYEPVKEKL